jgi:hypothetical protein
MQERRPRSTSAPPSPARPAGWDWEGKSIEFTKHMKNRTVESTISLQRVYEILQSAPPKKQRDYRADLSTAVVSFCSESLQTLAVANQIPQFSYFLLV